MATDDNKSEKNLKNTVKKTAKKIEDSTKEVLNDLDKNKDEIKNDLKKGAKKVKEKAKEVVNDIDENTQDFQHEAKSTADEFTKGAKEAYNNLTSNQDNKKVLAGILAIIFGAFGVHKFILGYSKEGLIMLIATFVLGILSFGLLAWVIGLIGFIEGIIYLTKSDADFYKTYQENKKPWF